MPSARERTTPAKERVTQLDDRLAELRARLGSLGERPSDPPLEREPSDGHELARVTRLARLVFNVVRGDPRLLRRFVHELARLEAEQTRAK